MIIDTIVSGVASGGVALSLLQGAKLITNGATATRWISDSGTSITLTGPVTMSAGLTIAGALAGATTGSFAATNAGIGIYVTNTVTSVAASQSYAVIGETYINGASTVSGSGLQGGVYVNSSATVPLAVGISTDVAHNGTGHITQAWGAWIRTIFNSYAGSIIEVVGLNIEQQTDGVTNFGIKYGTTGSEFAVTGAGSVGIGTYAPTQKLEVVGGVKLAGSLTGATTGAFSGRISSSVPAGSVAMSLLQTARLVFDSGTDGVYLSGDTATLHVTGQLDTTGAFSSGGQITSTNSITSGTSVRISTNQVLSLNGSTLTRTLGYDGTNFVFTGAPLAAPSLILTGSITGATTGTFSGVITSTQTTGNSLVIDTNTLVVDSTNHRVGIKTATPLYPLHLVGNYDNNALGPLHLVGTTATGGTAVSLDATAGGGKTFSIFSTGTSAGAGAGVFGIWDATASAYRLVVQSGGNIKIGDGSSAVVNELLYVNGGIGTLNGALTSYKTNANGITVFDVGSFNSQNGLQSKLFNLRNSSTSVAYFDINGGLLTGPNSNLRAVGLSLAALGTTPAINPFTTTTTGGTLAPGTYTYRVTAVTSAGETATSSQGSIVVPSGTSTNKVTITWTGVAGAIGYKVYGRTAPEATMFYLDTLGSVASTFTDDGSITPGGATFPTADTTSGINGSLILRQLRTPTNVPFVPAAGGSLAPGTYYYRVAASDGNGITIPSPETSLAISGANGSVQLFWSPVGGATSYSVYGRTTGAELLIATTPATTYTDTGSVTPSGAMPTTNTTGGNIIINRAGSGTAIGIPQDTLLVFNQPTNTTYLTGDAFGTLAATSAVFSNTGAFRSYASGGGFSWISATNSRIAYDGAGTAQFIYDGTNFNYYGAPLNAWLGVKSLLLPRGSLDINPLGTPGAGPANSQIAGTLGAGTYYHRVSAISAAGESIPNAEKATTITATQGVLVRWGLVLGATGYKVYGRTTGAEQLIATVSGGDTGAYSDTGAITPSGAMPTTDTTQAIRSLDTLGLRFYSSVVDGASAVAYSTDTTTSIVAAGAKLWSWRNNGVEKASVDSTGGWIGPTGTFSGALSIGASLTNTNTTTFTFFSSTVATAGIDDVFRFRPNQTGFAATDRLLSIADENNSTVVAVLADGTIQSGASTSQPFRLQAGNSASSPQFFIFKPLNTITNAAAKLIDIQDGGGTSQASFDRNGALTVAGVSANAQAITVPSTTRLSLNGASSTRYLYDDGSLTRLIGSDLVLSNALALKGRDAGNTTDYPLISLDTSARTFIQGAGGVSQLMSSAGISITGAPITLGGAVSAGVGDVSIIGLNVSRRVFTVKSAASQISNFTDWIDSNDRTGGFVDRDALWNGGVNAVGGLTLSGLSTPVNATFTTTTTGGSLTAGTYYYRVSAINTIGETLASTETSIVVPGGTSTNVVNVNWTGVVGATGYKVYGRSTGAELLIATVTGGGIATYQDTGAITPAGALPTTNTTGTIGGVGFGTTPIVAPSTVTATLGAGGTGTLAAATYTYKVSALGAFGETLVSTATATLVVTSGQAAAGASINVGWSAVTKATGYRVYGRIGTPLFIAAVPGQATVTYNDTGAITPSGAVPTVNTTQGLYLGNLSAGAGVVLAPNTSIVVDARATSGTAASITFDGFKWVLTSPEGLYANHIRCSGTSSATQEWFPNIDNLQLKLGSRVGPTDYISSDGFNTYGGSQFTAPGLQSSAGLGVYGLPATPVNGAHTTATTGGSLAPGTYYYRVSAVTVTGETLASTETSIVVPAGTSTNTVTVKWVVVSGATSYKIYGRTTGAELLLGVYQGSAGGVSNVLSFLDDGSITPAGALPTVNTTGDVVGGMNFAGFLPPPAPSLWSIGGGTLAAGTYWYRISATNAAGETLASGQQSIVLAVNQSAILNWYRVPGATGYKVYGRTQGAQLLIATISNGATTTYTDTGSVTPSGALPTVNTATATINTAGNVVSTGNVWNAAKLVVGADTSFTPVFGLSVFNNLSADVTARLQNSSNSGYTEMSFFDNTGANVGGVGYGNTGVAVTEDAGRNYFYCLTTGSLLLGSDLSSGILINGGNANSISINSPVTYKGAAGITAFAGGGQANATILTAEINYIDTVATANDSVKLVVSALGKRVVIFNDGANAVNIFPASGGAIDALGANAAYSLAAGASREFYGKSATLWKSR